MYIYSTLTTSFRLQCGVEGCHMTWTSTRLSAVVYSGWAMSCLVTWLGPARHYSGESTTTTKCRLFSIYFCIIIRTNISFSKYVVMSVYVHCYYLLHLWLFLVKLWLHVILGKSRTMISIWLTKMPNFQYIL